MYIITPQNRRTAILLTATAPISHHDPAQVSKSNALSYLRRKQVIPQSNTPYSALELQKIIDNFPVPEEIHEAMSTLSHSEFLATALIFQLLHLHNGQGLLEGQRRYEILGSRAIISAQSAKGFFAFWGKLCHDLQVDISSFGAPDSLISLFAIPQNLQKLVLAQVAKNTTSVITLARAWAQLQKLDKGKPVQIKQNDASENFSLVDVPSFSANSIRHEMVREPLAYHLLSTLGLVYQDLPPTVASLLYNGGDLSQQAPSNAFDLTRQIRENYPMLGLLGGSTKGFMLGSSNLEVSSWVVCKENNLALDTFGFKSDINANDLLDYDQLQKLTGGRIESSPMPFSFETLSAGTQILVDFRCRPYTTIREMGALYVALETFLALDSTIGGASARGFGTMNAQVITTPNDLDDAKNSYIAHISENAKKLKDGLLKCTLGTTTQVL